MNQYAQLMIIIAAWLSLGGKGGLFALFYKAAPGFSLFRLPGDIAIERENFRFYFPITTSIIISIVLSLIFLIARRFWG